MNQEAESNINLKQVEAITANLEQILRQIKLEDTDRLSKYQKKHLVILSSALFVSFATAVMFVCQVRNIAEQTRRNTAAVELQRQAVETQTKQMITQQQAVETQMWKMITQQMNDISKIFIEHPDMYPYFNKNQKISPKDEIYPKVITMADMILDFMDGFNDETVRKLKGMNDNGTYWIAWENYFVDQFRLAPVLCERYKEVKSWYTENGIVDKFATKGCSKTKQKNP